MSNNRFDLRSALEGKVYALNELKTRLEDGTIYRGDEYEIELTALLNDFSVKAKTRSPFYIGAVSAINDLLNSIDYCELFKVCEYNAEVDSLISVYSNQLINLSAN